MRFWSARQMVHDDEQHPAEQHGRIRLPGPRPPQLEACQRLQGLALGGLTPNPFHITYSMDGSKIFVSELHQKPAKGSIVVVDTSSWTTIKRFDNVGVDIQTLHVTY